MSHLNDFWESLAGIAIFLLGMNFLEESIHELAGRSFKLFLKRQTRNGMKAVGSGFVISAVLQSGSLVNLLVLGFASAGIIPLENALQLMLGTNLGSSATNWVIVTVGFSFNLESVALPLLGLAGIVMFMTERERKLFHWSRLVFGIAFLFTGLVYIKAGVGSLVQHIDLTAWRHQPTILFMLMGLLVTALIQSSSAMMAIVLSALSYNGISLVTAMAVILGAEIGTTLKLTLAASRSGVTARRIAVGNLLMNVVIVLIFLPFLPYLRNLLRLQFQANNLIALVLFQTLVNVASIILFLPLLRQVSALLRKFIRNTTDNDQLYRDGNPVLSPVETATDATGNLLHYAIRFMTNAFGRPSTGSLRGLEADFDARPLPKQYERIKVLHGGLHRFLTRNVRTEADEHCAERVRSFSSCSRNCMYACKSVHDMLEDIRQLQNSSNDIKYNFFLETASSVDTFCHHMLVLLADKSGTTQFEELQKSYKGLQRNYDSALAKLYQQGITERVHRQEISTLLNFNRQFFSACRSLIFAVKDYRLSGDQAQRFDSLPGFIR